MVPPAVVGAWSMAVVLWQFLEYCKMTFESIGDTNSKILAKMFILLL